jgi:hypothetical protein
MSIRATAIGLSVLTLVGTARAQDSATPPRMAAVDASGRILPLRTPTAAIRRIGGAFPAATPCGDATAIAPDAARALVLRIATEENFYPDFVQAIAKTESHFNSIALSDKGAFGLMQLMPETAQRFKVDLCDPADNIRGGVRFLRVLHEKYRNPLFILAAYNAGEVAVEENHGIPPFPETVRFVAQVINNFYAWPALASSSRRAPDREADDHSSLIEPGLARATPGTSAPQSSPQARWRDGFVMHVD